MKRISQLNITPLSLYNSFFFFETVLRPLSALRRQVSEHRSALGELSLVNFSCSLFVLFSYICFFSFFIQINSRLTEIRVLQTVWWSICLFFFYFSVYLFKLGFYRCLLVSGSGLTSRVELRIAFPTCQLNLSFGIEWRWQERSQRSTWRRHRASKIFERQGRLQMSVSDDLSLSRQRPQFLQARSNSEIFDWRLFTTHSSQWIFIWFFVTSFFLFFYSLRFFFKLIKIQRDDCSVITFHGSSWWWRWQFDSTYLQRESLLSGFALLGFATCDRPNEWPYCSANTSTVWSVDVVRVFETLWMSV